MYDPDNWTPDTTDWEALNDSGESRIAQLPVINPDNTGVYVVSYDNLPGYDGKRLNFHGITGWLQSSAFDGIECKFFDGSTYMQTYSVPSHGKIYAAVRLSAGQTKTGLITVKADDTVYTPDGNENPIQPVESSERAKIRKNIAQALGMNEEDIVFLNDDNIKPAPDKAGETRLAPVSTAANEVDTTKDHYEIMKGLGTIYNIERVYTYKPENGYTFKLQLLADVPSEINAKRLSDDISNKDGKFGFYTEEEAEQAVAQFRASFAYGLINTWEILTVEGKKLDKDNFGAREFLMVAFLNSSVPFTVFLAKLIPGISQFIGSGGCSSVPFGFAAGLLIIALAVHHKKH